MWKMFDKALKRYETADIATRMKARLFFILCFVMLLILPITISYTSYLHLTYPTYGYKLNIAVVIPELIAFFLFIVILILLVRGYFTASANMAVVLFLISTWTVMIMDRASAVSRLDTIAYIFGIMSITPLALVHKGLLILLYGGINIAVMIGFVFVFRSQFDIPDNSVIDYLADNSAMLLFVSIAAFGQFVIHRRALDTAQKELEERRHAEEVLKQSLNEKEILIKEIHHRVKNNMQVVSSLISLQSKKIDDPKYFALFMETQNRIQAMALIHEMLYNSKDMSKIDFSTYLNDLTQYLFSIYITNQQQVHVHLNVKDVYFGIDTAVPCGMIINELVSNALKHAFPDGREGTVTVDLFKSPDGKHMLTVSDNGVGIPKGFNIDTSDSLGMLIVNSLTKQLEGSISIDGSKGVVVRIMF